MFNIKQEYQEYRWSTSIMISDFHKLTGSIISYKIHNVI